VNSFWAAEAGFHQDGDPRRAGHELMEKLQALRAKFTREKIDAGQVDVWPGKAGGKTDPDWVLVGDEYNGDRLCCRLGRQSHIITGRGNHADLAANQFGSEFRQPIALIFGKRYTIATFSPSI
jgi:hypothetical protein